MKSTESYRESRVRIRDGARGDAGTEEMQGPGGCRAKANGSVMPQRRTHDRVGQEGIGR